MATSAPVLSSDVGALEDILDRSLAPQISDLTIAEFDVDGTAEHICRGFRRVALQFPDQLLPHAEGVYEALKKAVAQRWSLEATQPVLFVLADTTFDGFQVDFVSAQHLGADMLVHYGPADLQAHGPMEVRFVFCRRPIAVPALAAAYADAFEPERRVLVVFSLAYEHASKELAQALAASHPGAIVSTAEVERGAETAKPQRGADGTFEAPSGGGEGDSGEFGDRGIGTGGGGGGGGDGTGGGAAVSEEGGASAADALRGDAGGDSRLLGRRLPVPLSQAELAACALLCAAWAPCPPSSSLPRAQRALPPRPGTSAKRTPPWTTYASSSHSPMPSSTRRRRRRRRRAKRAASRAASRRRRRRCGGCSWPRRSD